MDRSRLICAGNTSLAGAEKILLDRTCIDDIDRILDEMVYIQFGQVAFHLYDESGPGNPTHGSGAVSECTEEARRKTKREIMAIA